MTEVKSDAEILQKAAEEKFGKMLMIKKRNGMREYSLTIKRDNPTFPDAPYMKITGAVTAVDKVGIVPQFYWGHYDLTEAQVFAQD